MQIVSRNDAKAAGLKYYFTGKPCQRGHIDQRFVSSFQCLTCGRDVARETYRGLDDNTRKRIYQRKKEYIRQWVATHRDRKAASDYAARNKLKALKPDYFRDHYAQNKERRRREASEWYHANSDRALRIRRDYVAKNRDKARVWGRKSANKRRAITKQVFVEAVDPRVVFERAKGVCGICGESVEMTSRWEVDHIVPISKGGSHCYANVQLAHRRCNRSKGAKCA
jgi:5-methylcytosine-specific restriction endonuclease McrA